MRAEPYADELELVLYNAIDKHEVRFDMAVAESGVAAGKGMVAERGRQRSLSAEQINDGRYLFQTFSATDRKLEVARELLREDAAQHGGQSSIAKAAFSISSVLLNGPYVGSVPAMSRSRIARVSAFGVSLSSSSSTMGNGKPRCSRVCMRRTFMPVEVVMPRREKRRSARRLISGLTRNAIVADAMAECSPLFDNSAYYSTVSVQRQVCRPRGDDQRVG